MNLESEIFKITCDLYNNLHFSKNSIHFIIDLLRTFIKDIYNHFLLKQLENRVLKVLSADITNHIRSTFEKETGLDLSINNKTYKVYFITNLVLGDNLGQNEILGFVKSFVNTPCCRMCEADGRQIKSLTCEKNELLRNAEKYENYFENLNYRWKGVTEKCIFNNIRDFNVVQNSSVDIMHDVFEGVANKVMAQIILKLVEVKCIKIEYINAKLRTIDFQFENTNVPIDIRLDYVKLYKRLRMSASESLCFTRYFGLIVGNAIVEDHVVWPLYSSLRGIIDIVTSPTITEECFLHLNALIKELNSLYIDLFDKMVQL
ncbi:hypothetical protein TSAR_015468 [Trichomalopsis sarcophagae]|uniref:Uncharacterized protein n=1 Tax=Trichomalopsis sarcophagae TaxID=543379 RepID=A0A232FBK0_9HYME|nr:hypothetical protein TSAR_015468 [Trichomalopsis sarcophagae]